MVAVIIINSIIIRFDTAIARYGSSPIIFDSFQDALILFAGIFNFISFLPASLQLLKLNIRVSGVKIGFINNVFF